MARESQTSRVTHIQVRVDCNGCLQKIKKALNGIPGIHDLCVDFNRQKLTVIGWADPETVIKAIKKTKKNATICSNIELLSPSKPTKPEPKGNAPAPKATQPPKPTKPEPKGNALAPEATQPPPAQASPNPASPPSGPSPEATPSPAPTQHNTTQQWQNNPRTKDLEHIHMTHQHLPNYVNRFSSDHNHVERWDRYRDRPVFLREPSQSMYVSHCYNTHMPSTYVTEYEYVHSPSRHTHHNGIEHYSEDYQYSNVNIASIFSDDNPNACSIV